MPGRKRGASVVPIAEDGTPVIPVVPLIAVDPQHNQTVVTARATEHAAAIHAAVPVTEVTPTHEMTEEQARPFNPVEQSPTGFVPNFRVNDDGNAEPLPEQDADEYQRPEFMSVIFTHVYNLATTGDESDGVAAIASIAVGLDRLTEVVGVVAQQQQWVTNTISQMKGEFDSMMGSGNPLKMMANLAGFGGRK